MSRIPDSRWRRAARKAIEAAIAEATGDGAAWPDGVDKVIKAIDAAYPFGERKYWPYKMWLLERRAALARLRPVEGAIDVACPACDANPGGPCNDIASGVAVYTFHEARVMKAPPPADDDLPLFAQPT